MSGSQHHPRTNQRAAASSPPAVAEIAAQMTDGVPRKSRSMDFMNTAVAGADDRIIDGVREIGQQIDFGLHQTPSALFCSGPELGAGSAGCSVASSTSWFSSVGA